jgi:hypothetical protein
MTKFLVALRNREKMTNVDVSRKGGIMNSISFIFEDLNLNKLYHYGKLRKLLSGAEN